MPVTLADVIRELAAAAPERVFARAWLEGVLAALPAPAPPEPSPAVAPAPAPPPAIPHPFASDEDHHAAFALLRAGKAGRFIAAEFDVPLMATAVWAQRARGGGVMSPRQIALLLLAAAPATLLADLPMLGRHLPWVAVLTWAAAAPPNLARGLR